MTANAMRTLQALMSSKLPFFFFVSSRTHEAKIDLVPSLARPFAIGNATDWWLDIQVCSSRVPEHLKEMNPAFVTYSDFLFIWLQPGDKRSSKWPCRACICHWASDTLRWRQSKKDDEHFSSLNPLSYIKLRSVLLDPPNGDDSYLFASRNSRDLQEIWALFNCQRRVFLQRNGSGSFLSYAPAIDSGRNAQYRNLCDTLRGPVSSAKSIGDR
jgi:hypothetical protein